MKRYPVTAAHPKRNVSQNIPTLGGNYRSRSVAALSVVALGLVVVGIGLTSPSPLTVALILSSGTLAINYAPRAGRDDAVAFAVGLLAGGAQVYGGTAENPGFLLLALNVLATGIAGVAVIKGAHKASSGAFAQRLPFFRLASNRGLWIISLPWLVASVAALSRGGFDVGIARAWTGIAAAFIAAMIVTRGPAGLRALTSGCAVAVLPVAAVQAPRMSWSLDSRLGNLDGALWLHPNVLALFVLIGVLGVALTQSTPRHIRSGPVFTASLVIIMATGSRTALLVLLIILVGDLMVIRLPGLTWKRAELGALAGISLLALVVASLLLGPTLIQERAAGVGTLSERDVFWDRVLEDFAQADGLGKVFGPSSDATGRLEVAGQGRLVSAHNAAFTLLAATGLAGLAVATIGAISVLANAIRARRRVGRMVPVVVAGLLSSALVESYLVTGVLGVFLVYVYAQCRESTGPTVAR